MNEGCYRAELIYDNFHGERRVLRTAEGNLEKINTFEKKYYKFTKYLEVSIIIEYCEECK